jgi:hypothetical protein
MVGRLGPHPAEALVDVHHAAVAATQASPALATATCWDGDNDGCLDCA